MMMVGSVISVSTRPPTRGAERGRPKKLMKTARPSRPKTIDGTAARLLMLTSMRSVQPVLRGELLEIDRGGDADRQRQQQHDQHHVERADDGDAHAGGFRPARCAVGEQAGVEVLGHRAVGLAACSSMRPAGRRPCGCASATSRSIWPLKAESTLAAASTSTSRVVPITEGSATTMSRSCARAPSERKPLSLRDRRPVVGIDAELGDQRVRAPASDSWPRSARSDRSPACCPDR